MEGVRVTGELDCFASLAMTTGWILHLIIGQQM